MTVRPPARPEDDRRRSLAYGNRIFDLAQAAPFHAGMPGTTDCSSCPKVFEQFLFQRPAGPYVQAAVDRFGEARKRPGTLGAARGKTLARRDLLNPAILHTVSTARRSRPPSQIARQGKFVGCFAADCACPVARAGHVIHGPARCRYGRATCQTPSAPSPWTSPDWESKW